MTWVKMDSRREKQNGEVEEKKKDEETSSDDKNGEEITLADKKNEDISMIDLPENVLSEKLQLEALAKVRQAKWFQVKLSLLKFRVILCTLQFVWRVVRMFVFDSVSL